MKKKILLFAGLMLSAFLIACSNDTDAQLGSQVNSQTETQSETQNNTESDKDTSTATEDKTPETSESLDVEVPWNQIGLEPTDKITVTYEDEKIVSLCIEGIRYVEGTAHPWTEIYGITIDKKNNSVLRLKDFIPSQFDLTEQIEAECYDVAYGVYYDWDKTKILESIEKELKWDDWTDYYLNYYVDETYVNIIVPTELSDYSILRVKRTDQSGTSALDPTVSEKELTLMQKVLFNQAEFYGNIDSYEKEYGWHKVEEIYGYEWNAPRFGVLDFDKDGKDEVYVYYGDALILHEEDGVIYGYVEPYRGLSNVCTDGTFIGSGGAADNDLMGNVQFHKHEMTYDIITSTCMDLSAEEYTRYYKNAGWWSDDAIEITAEEYAQIMDQYQKEVNVMHNLTTSTLLEYVK